jgi:hypothetical protein
MIEKQTCRLSSISLFLFDVQNYFIFMKYHISSKRDARGEWGEWEMGDWEMGGVGEGESGGRG